MSIVFVFRKSEGGYLYYSPPYMSPGIYVVFCLNVTCNVSVSSIDITCLVAGNNLSVRAPLLTEKCGTYHCSPVWKWHLFHGKTLTFQIKMHLFCDKTYFSPKWTFFFSINTDLNPKRWLLVLQSPLHVPRYLCGLLSECDMQCKCIIIQITCFVASIWPFSSGSLAYRKKWYPSLLSSLKMTPFSWQNTVFSCQNVPFLQ